MFSTDLITHPNSTAAPSPSSFLQVRALTHGRVLVLDEADKAPLEVTCVLRSLLAEGSMVLADGRRIAPIGTPPAPGILPIQPGFRAIVLANRPGYPFLGNDFFRECGDVLSCHTVLNPDLSSEVQLLQQYGHDVPHALLTRVAAVFADLRALADGGELAYPFSTREAVSLVRHMQVRNLAHISPPVTFFHPSNALLSPLTLSNISLIHSQAYPQDGLLGAADNVFSFDSHQPQLSASLASVLRRHGIPAATGGAPFSVKLAPTHPLLPSAPLESWRTGKDVTAATSEDISAGLPVQAASHTRIEAESSRLVERDPPTDIAGQVRASLSPSLESCCLIPSEST